ncbi:MAG: glutamate formimidoyltransferase [Planctomycetota bacterium]|jgi:glutamate formiminotransferase
MAWIECVSNISEGRRSDVIRAIVDSIRSVPGVELRSVHSDFDHNRSVFTIIGSPPSVSESAFRCVAEATERIDLSQHEGVHPPLGAADVVALVPLAGTKMKRCADRARSLADRIEAKLGVPAYRFGAASDDDESLGDVRRRAEEAPAARAHPSAGVVAVGAREAEIAFNVNLATTDLDAAKNIAKALRESDGGLPAVQALAFPLASRDCVQVSTNLLDYRKTSPLRVYRTVRRLAREAKIEVEGSEVVGTIPRDAVARSFRSSVRCGPIEVLDEEPDFIQRVAAQTPVPAGGSAAAHTGALAAALVVMSCDASRPSPRLLELRTMADALRAELTELAETDVTAFRKVLRDRSQEALKEATAIPVRIAECSAEIWSIAAAAAHHCDDMVATDCSGGRRLAEAARDMAAETARANLPQISDGTFRSRVARRLAAAFSG